MSVLSEYLNVIARLKRAIDESLETDVANAVKEEMSQKVHDEVYDAYAPLYPDSRREDRGGLSSVFNYDSRVEPGHLLIVENNTPAQHPTALPLTEIVEEGLKEYHMPFARPFVELTEKSVNAEDALTEGLHLRGF